MDHVEQAIHARVKPRAAQGEIELQRTREDVADRLRRIEGSVCRLERRLDFAQILRAALSRAVCQRLAVEKDAPRRLNEAGRRARQLDLPQPDSPITPRLRPGSIVSPTSLTMTNDGMPSGLGGP
jgi:hypothetical protein